MMKHELLSINVKFLFLALTLYFNEKCKPHFWVKAISMVANFGSTRSASTSVGHKQKIKFLDLLSPRPPPSGLNCSKMLTIGNANYLKVKNIIFLNNNVNILISC